MVGIVGLSNGNNIDLVDAWVAFLINALVALFSIHTLSFKVRICVLSPCSATCAVQILSQYLQPIHVLSLCVDSFDTVVCLSFYTLFCMIDV